MRFPFESHGRVLAQLGLPCETAASGEEALRILETRRIDAVISDLQMPGMSGMELLAKVRQSYPQMVFLVVTGVDDIRVGVQAMRQGADDYSREAAASGCKHVSASSHARVARERLEQEVENYHLPDHSSRRKLSPNRPSNCEKLCRHIERAMTTNARSWGCGQSI